MHCTKKTVQKCIMSIIIQNKTPVRIIYTHTHQTHVTVFSTLILHWQLNSVAVSEESHTHNGTNIITHTGSLWTLWWIIHTTLDKLAGLNEKGLVSWLHSNHFNWNPNQLQKPEIPALTQTSAIPTSNSYLSQLTVCENTHNNAAKHLSKHKHTQYTWRSSAWNW